MAIGWSVVYFTAGAVAGIPIAAVEISLVNVLCPTYFSSVLPFLMILGSGNAEKPQAAASPPQLPPPAIVEVVEVDRTNADDLQKCGGKCFASCQHD